jgi:soluble lytic murein transglycosylase
LELEAVALLRAGEREGARNGFREVIRLQPLSFAALCARAHLATLQESGAVPTLPASSEPAVAPRPIDPQFPAGARLLHQLGLDREAELALGESEREVSAQYPGRADEALCLLYGQLASAERAFRLGQRVATEQELNHAPQVGRRWLWDCVYPRPYAGLINAAASEHAIAPELIYAVMRQESSFRPQVTSPANAVGLLQILPSTASRLSAELGLPFAANDLTRPANNVRLGAYYLSKLLNAFQGNLPLAVASYNAGPRAVAYWLEHARGLDLELFVARIPYEETRNYVERVVGNYARYQYLQTGDELRLALELPRPVADPSSLY